MKVRKPKSKRVPVRLRHKIEKASAAKQRKQRKLAKNNPEWRSRLKKDPGVPNLFPYKDKILHEIEESKRRKEEEALRRKAEAQSRRDGITVDESSNGAAMAGEDEVDVLLDLEDEDDESMDDADAGGKSSNPMAALIESARASAKNYDHANAGDMSGEDMEDDESDAASASPDEFTAEQASRKDSSRRAFDKAYKQVLSDSDVILYVLDARDPLGTRSRAVEETVVADPSKRLILILNKIDLVPADVLKSWLLHLRRSFPTLPLRAAASAAGANTFNHKHLTPQFTAGNLLRALKSYASAQHRTGPTSVGVIGYPNTGKSSVINALTSRLGGTARRGGKECPVGAEAGITTAVRRVKLDGKITLLDSPGIVFPGSPAASAQTAAPSSGGPSSGAADEHARLILLNAIPPREISDPAAAVALLLRRMSAQPALLAALLGVYGIPEGTLGSRGGGDVTNDFLIQVARRRGRLGRGGVPNLHAAAQAVVADWREGRIRGWAAPPAREPSGPAGDASGAVASAASQHVSVDRTEIVGEWAKEFRIEGLWGGEVDDEQNAVGDVAMQT